MLAAGERFRRRLAEKIRLAVLDRVETVRGGHQHVSDLEVGDVELLADVLGDREAKIDYEAGRQARLVGERERRRIFAKGNAQRLVLPHLIESARVSRSQSQRRGCRERQRFETSDRTHVPPNFLRIYGPNAAAS